MRLSTRLLSNAATTYLRLGTTFLIGLFTTWYMLGAIGVVGFGLLALATSTTGPSHAIEKALRVGLVRELAVAVASGQRLALVRHTTAAFLLCLRATVPVLLVAAAAALAALFGLLRVPEDARGLQVALAVLIAAEGAHATVRLLSAPYIQSIFAAQHVALDNLLIVVARVTYPLSAILVFSWIAPGAGLPRQLMLFGASRVSLQLLDVLLGVWLARKLLPDLRIDLAADCQEEYLEVRSTVWHSSQLEVLMNLNPQFLAIIINLFFGLTYNGIWQIVVQFSGFARMFSEGMLRGIAPLTAHLRQSNNLHASTDLMIRSIRYQLAVALPVGIALSLFARPILELWIGGRLEADPHLLASGISIAQALRLASAMVVVMVIFQTLRAAFFGVERVLYGLGEVASYAWFAKWSTFVATGLALVSLAYFREPLLAPISLLLAYWLYILVLWRAARKATGVDLFGIFRQAFLPPLLAHGVLLLLLVPLRFVLDSLDLLTLAGLLGGTMVYLVAAGLLFIATPEEKRRILEMPHKLRERIRTRPPAPDVAVRPQADRSEPPSHSDSV